MIPVYLKENYTGAYSVIQYGLKGDKVFILKREPYGMTLVMNESGLKFYVHETILSLKPVEKDAVIIPVQQKLKRKIRRIS